jgi:hypothetical protein
VIEKVYEFIMILREAGRRDERSRGFTSGKAISVFATSVQGSVSARLRAFLDFVANRLNDELSQRL